MNIDNPEYKIPFGPYCYEHIRQEGMTIKVKTCPYWRRIYNRPTQMNGYCIYLGVGDWQPNGTLFLWDMVKECGVNEEWEE